MSSTTPEQHIYFADLWIPATEAAELVGLSKQGFHDIPIKRGVCRAVKDPETGHSLIFKDDVLYVYNRRTEAGKQKLRNATYETLIERDVFPAECAGMDGYELTLWAKEHRPSLLQTRLRPPPLILADDPATGQPTRRLLTLETLHGELETLRASVHNLLAAQGVDTTWSRLSDAELRGLLKGCRQALDQGALEPKEILYWCRVLSRLSPEHVAQLHAFSQGHTQEVRRLAGDGASYAMLLRLARALQAQASALPGTNLVQSVHYRIKAMADKTHRHVRQLVTGQATIDALLQDGTPRYLPAPLTRTDRYILSRLVPSERLPLA